MAVDSQLDDGALSMNSVGPRKKGCPTMYKQSLLRGSILMVPVFVASLACDAQPEGTVPEGALGPALSRKAVSAAPSSADNEGHAKVEVVFNNAPKVDAMTSSAGRVSSGAAVTLKVAASDVDGDALTFAWTSNCPGAFDRSDMDAVTFTCGTLSSGMVCAFAVVVSDGHGGAGKGSLVLSSVAPVINVAPAMGIVYQTTNAANAAEVVLLHASASDPEGQSLTWTWKASDGVLSEQKDEAGVSDVHWMAPTIAGAHCTVTATATDPAGASASYVFDVQVVGG